MTREEVINGLYDIKNWKCNGDAKMYKTIVEAIQALKHPEPCEDAVSRNTLKEYFTKRQMDADIMKEVFDAIDLMPSVTPKRKTGKWT